MFVPHITRKIGIFTKGFIKLSSQFIFSREQSTFVISYISLLRHLTEFPPHLFAKSRSTVALSHCLSRNYSRHAFFFACLHRLRGCALQPHHIKVTGFEPMALCTQNRCADQTALHLVSPPEAYRSARSMNTRTELAHPFGHRGARTNPSNQPLFFFFNLPPALYGFLPSSFT